MTPPVIISGMHRSATSLLASMFHRAGLHLGDRLLEPSPSNRPGYFEDREFIAFHDSLLGHLGTTMYLESPPRGELGPEHRERGTALIEARHHRDAWGWKDPRTCLFLDFWRSIVPEARYVFVVRRPAEVMDSLRRRGDAEMHLQYPGAATLARIGVPRFRIRRAADLWLRYNERIAAFAERHRERCHVIRAADVATAGPRVIEELRREGVPMHGDVDAETVIRTDLLVHRATPAIERYCRRSRAVNDLLRRLEALAGD
ncbi:MAG: hypothetical protein ACYTEV_08055 [Planctomycetota bacterium]|jgi:hypothetical protein